MASRRLTKHIAVLCVTRGELRDPAILYWSFFYIVVQSLLHFP